MSNINRIQLARKLTTPELRKRKEEVIAVLNTRVLEKLELKDGFSYRFESSDEMMDSLVAFIKGERQCCNFFSFSLTILNDEGSIWLNLTGPDGVKEFIRTELSF